ncbi:MAG: carboxypeptidase regulatory-like domain-containing protein [Acidobacteria bacterium]|nr:carboxypeptidase regulatory-like domain-containing protein [Acidobacteriota bacterium]
MRSFTRLVVFLFLVLTSSVLALGQTSSLSGTVTDPSGAVVAGASVKVKNAATGAGSETSTSSSGAYTIPALGAGVYTVTIEARGFKTVAISDVKINAATPATVNATLEVGAQSETVTVQGGGEVLQTQSANVATTIQGRQITELPFTSRDALDLVLLLPGTNTPGRPRTSTINGLPKGALNITMDGVNVQDNILKSSDGFFTYVRPRIDAVDEVTVSTATPGAESAGEGAVQIKFVTRSGSNEYHGSLYEYHRNPALNANYWFNNRDSAPKPGFTTAPRDFVLLNQFGGRIGGPIALPGFGTGGSPLRVFRDRAFFFVNYEEFRIPEQATRQRTILSDAARTGIFRYGTSGSVNLYTLATQATTGGCTACTNTPDPTIAKLLQDIEDSTKTTGATLLLTDPNLERFTFTNAGNQARFFPTVRLDFNLNEKHKIENVWNYQKFTGTVDFLNGTDPAFPNFPNQGFQGSNRFSNTTALRSTITPAIVNEARFGITGGTVLFFPNVNKGQFTGSLANQDGFSIGIGTAGITGATVSTSPSRRNAPVKQFLDTLTWTKGSHSMSFGGSFSNIDFWSWSQAQVPTITLGLDASDPANAMFNTTNFPGASNTDLANARNIYATLTGRVTAINANAILNEKTLKYTYLGENVQRGNQKEYGIFASDSWRVNPNLTLNYGVRWEVQLPFQAKTNVYSQTTFNELFGISGPGNLFKPGTQTGKVTEYTQFKAGDVGYNTDYNNFAPSFGFAWSPNTQNSLLKKAFGEGGQTVIRGGYSIAFNREGLNVFTSILGANPGLSIVASRNITLGNLGTLPVLFRDKSRLGAPSFTTDPVYPNQGAITNSANAFNPNLQLGYVQSWTFGIQRELNRDTVIEARYVGNRGIKLWQQYNLNEINIIENGFLNEFKLAQANLQANIANGRGNNFRYYGAGTGTNPLPIMLAFFTGQAASAAGTAGNYSNSNFANATYVNALAANGPSPFTFASTGSSGFIGSATFRNNGLTAGLPANFFLVNPGKLGGAWSIENNGRSWYDSLQVELRRRLSKGLLVQGNYTFAKAFTNAFASSSVVAGQPSTLRNMALSKTISPFNVTHAFKVNWIYELPFGKGKWLAGNAGRALDLAIGGWEFHGAARLQSGTPFNFGNVRLVGMNRNDLQKAVQMRFNDAGRIAYFLPQDIIDNTIKANNVSATSSTGYGTAGAPTGRYIAPASFGSCIEAFTGQCGTTNLVLNGPRFDRYDLSVIKKFRMTETTNFELRAEFLNAFNHINFIVGSPNNDVNTIGGFSSATFGQVTQAYRDTSTTNDPGGRLVQIVARFNF